MKTSFLLIVVIFLFSCNSPKQKVDRSSDVIVKENKKAIVKIDEPVIKDSVVELVFESDSVNFDFFVGKISYDVLKELERILLDYRAIKNDTQMYHFYKYKLDKAANLMDSSFYEYVSRNELDGESEIYDWGGIIRETFPFLIGEYGGEFDGVGIFQNYHIIYNKCLTTEGKSDEEFFKIYMDCYGPHNSTYDHINFSYDDGKGFSSMGEKRVLSVIRKIAAIESSIFYYDLIEIGQNIINIEDSFFAFSKEEVFEELDALLILKDSVRLNFDKIEKLRAFLDTTTTEVYYDCQVGDCPEW